MLDSPQACPRCCAPPSPPPPRHLTAFQLCRVLDAALLCANVAADPAFVSAADAASARLGVYVHGLNAHAGLHAALDATLRAAAAGHVVLTAEEARVAALLRTECEREGGLLLGDGPRGELLGMQAELAAASVRFRQNIAAPEQFGAAPARPPSSLFLPILPPSLFSPGPTGAHGAPRLTPEWG